MAARDQKISQPTHSYPQMRYRSVFDTNFNVISATNQLCMWSKCYPNCILFIGHSKRQPYIVDSIKIYFICNQFALNFQKQKPKKKKRTNDHSWHRRQNNIKQNTLKVEKRQRQKKHWHILYCASDCKCARWPKLWFLFLTKIQCSWTKKVSSFSERSMWFRFFLHNNFFL